MRQWCSGLVLSGGRGARMGGRDKGLVDWWGMPMAKRVCRQMRPLVGELMVSCNRNQARYATFCDRTLGDAQTDYPGPLAGILAGLRNLRGSHLLVAPCDLPAVDGELLGELQELAWRQPQRVVAVRQGERLQPLLCVLPRSALAQVETAWAAGERSPGRLWQRLGAEVLACAADDPRLINFNCPELLGLVGRPLQPLGRAYADPR